MKMNYLKTGLLGAGVLACHLLPAQEIPSRINEGVNTPAKKEAKKDAFYDLKLSREQMQRLQALNKDNRQQLKGIAEDESLTQAQKKERSAKVRQQLVQQRKSVLTPEQNARYEQHVKELKENNAEGQKKNVANNVEKKRNTDENGLSRESAKTTSKKKNGDWNDLKLTGEQREQLRKITDEYSSRLQVARSNISYNANEKQEQIRLIQREYDMELRTLLTAEQKVKWDDRQRRARMTMTGRQLQNNKQGLNGLSR